MPYPLKPKYIRQFYTKPKRISETHSEVKIVQSMTDSWFADKFTIIWCWMRGWTRIPKAFRDADELSSYLREAGFRDFEVTDRREDRW